MTPLPQFLSKQTLTTRVIPYLQSLVEEGNYKLTFKPVSQRTLDQNAKIQAMCTDIANQVVLDTVHYGYKLKSDCQYFKQFSHNDWRHILMAGFTSAPIVPGIERGQAVCLYPSTTELSLSRGSDFIDYMTAWGNDMGVEWKDE